MKLQQNRKFSDEFRRKAVQLSLDSPDTVKSVALSLGIGPSLLSKWRAQLTSSKKTNKPLVNSGPEKSIKDLERENKLLKKKLEDAERENQFLKKAKAYFDSLKE